MKLYPAFLLLLLLLCACTTVGVQVLKENDFDRYNIPRRIVIFEGNDTLATRQVVAAIASSFSGAGFKVVSRADAAKALGAENLTPEDLVARFDFAPLCTTANIDGVVLIRQFYGTELQLIEAKTGRVRASGCWQTSYINIVNEVIGQMKDNKPSPRLCPSPLQ